MTSGYGETSGGCQCDSSIDLVAAEPFGSETGAGKLEGLATRCEAFGPVPSKNGAVSAPSAGEIGEEREVAYSFRRLVSREAGGSMVAATLCIISSARVWLCTQS